MKNIILYFFAALGFIFLIILFWLTYFFIADPYNIKPLIFGSSSVPAIEQNEAGTGNSSEAAGTMDENGEATTATRATFNLSTAQKEALLNLGIAPESIPDSISVEQEQCFVDILGVARVNEIRAGAVPGSIEFFRAKACI